VKPSKFLTAIDRKEVNAMIDTDRYPHGIVEIDPTTAH
jgi:hypothetical protein